MMEFAAAPAWGSASLDALRGDLLVVPAVSLGNVGQMAMDLVMNTANSRPEKTAGEEAQKVGALRSSHVLPMAGVDPLDVCEGAEKGQLCSSIEIYRIASRKITLLQIRAPIVEGASAEFAEELSTWISTHGFASILILAGSDSSANFEKEVMMHEFRFLASDAVSPEDLDVLRQTGIPPLDVASSPRLPVFKAGLLSALFNVCQAQNLPMRALILFCKEGFNVPEACMMGAALQAIAKDRAAEAAAAAASILGDLSFTSADSNRPRRTRNRDENTRHQGFTNVENDDDDNDDDDDDDGGEDQDEESEIDEDFSAPTSHKQISRGKSAPAEPVNGKRLAGRTSIHGDDLETLIQQKQRELQEMNEFRLQSLERTLRGKDEQLRVAEEKFAKLSEDFNYNLQLIADRDAELDKFDTAFAKVKEIISDKEAEASELRMQIDDLEAQLEAAAVRARENEDAHERRLADLRTNMEGGRVALETRHRKERLALEEALAQLEHRLQEKDDDLEAQRREMAATYDELSRQRYRDYEHRIEELQNANKELQDRVKQQTEAQTRERAAKNAAQNRAAELGAQFDASEKRCKQLVWELEDTQRLKDARIEELESEVADLKDLKQSILDEHETKMTDLLSSLHAVEQAFVQQKEHYEAQLERQEAKRDEALRSQTSGLEDRLSALADKLRAAETQLETSRADFTKAKWDYEEQLAVKQREVETLRDEISTGSSRRDTDAAKLRTELAEKTARLRSLESQVARAQEDLKVAQERVATALDQANRARDDAEDAKQQLAEARALAQGDGSRDAEKHLCETLETKNREQASVIETLQTTVTELRAQVAAVQEEMRSQAWKSSLGGGGGSGGGTRAFPGAKGHAQSSPTFDGDLGPPSPLSSMTVTSAAEDMAEVGRLQIANADLQREKDALASALRAMRAEMESMAMQLQEMQDETSPIEPQDKESGSQSRPEHIVERECLLLREQAQDLHAYIAHLQAVAEREKHQGLTPSDEVAETRLLRKLLRTQEHQIVATLTSENGRLKREVDLAQKEIKQVTEERDRLADLANKLRAELKHSSRSSVTTDQLDQVERQVAATFESKIRSVELALEQLVAQNRTLKLQLRAAQAQAAVNESDDFGEKTVQIGSQRIRNYNVRDMDESSDMG
ncbi:Proteasome assembly chaperone 2 [Hondaea fermentalgiana]|uniref:Proteasome assembly chaperone 2 n=1 Tax=Hondaea fermentalgiana TaxID=2315210 RepID=A0A2R5GES0_9STRA|nr:Proteasome assembly chaperone 2 [Hondaea fermentalgiana]|eukprot:GBG28799.1 Proteasome assembly chaperone 2 [Hondaea fermentalgiana]